MLFQGLTVLLLACVAHGQYALYNGACPPENSHVVQFRNLTDVRAPIFIPLVDRVLKDAQYALPEIAQKLANVDLPWKLTLPFNNTNSILPYAALVINTLIQMSSLDRCCQTHHHACSSVDIKLSYLKFQGGICWVVYPEHHFAYKRCTCCSCLLAEDAPVVGRCVETDYQTVGIIAYCPHIMYSDRFQKIAVKIPTRCRCQAACPTPLDYALPDGSPSEERRLQGQGSNRFQQALPNSNGH